MLAADRLLLQSSIKDQAVKLKSKELDLYERNYGEIGLQSSVLASCAVVAMVELHVPEHVPPFVQMCFNISCILCLAANLNTIASTTTVTVLGSSLALRGPDGSMFRSVEAMNKERRTIFIYFGCGVVFAHFMAIAAAFVKMRPETAIAAACILSLSLYNILSSTRERFNKFWFTDQETIDFGDLWEVGPSARPDQLNRMKIDGVAGGNENSRSNV